MTAPETAGGVPDSLPGVTRFEGELAYNDFEDPDFAFDWWGWIYRGGDCGTWVNSIDENCGDIHCDWGGSSVPAERVSGCALGPAAEKQFS